VTPYILVWKYQRCRGNCYLHLLFFFLVTNLFYTYQLYGRYTILSLQTRHSKILCNVQDTHSDIDEGNCHGLFNEQCKKLQESEQDSQRGWTVFELGSSWLCSKTYIPYTVTDLHFYLWLVMKLTEDSVRTYNIKFGGKMITEDEKLKIYVLRLCYNSRDWRRIFLEKYVKSCQI
jgi:hypothetical protein